VALNICNIIAKSFLIFLPNTFWKSILCYSSTIYLEVPKDRPVFISLDTHMLTQCQPKETLGKITESNFGQYLSQFKLNTIALRTKLWDTSPTKRSDLSDRSGLTSSAIWTGKAAGLVQSVPIRWLRWWCGSSREDCGCRRGQPPRAGNSGGAGPRAGCRQQSHSLKHFKIIN